MTDNKRTNEDYYIESKRLRNEVLRQAEQLKGHPIPGYLEKAQYLGWRPVAEGKHIESAYFAYFSRELGCRTILCMRRMADGDIYKPYAIINDHTFGKEAENLHK